MRDALHVPHSLWARVVLHRSSNFFFSFWGLINNKRKMLELLWSITLALRPLEACRASLRCCLFLAALQESHPSMSHLTPWDKQSPYSLSMSPPMATLSCRPAIVSCLSDCSELMVEVGQSTHPFLEADLPYQQGLWPYWA